MTKPTTNRVQLPELIRSHHYNPVSPIENKALFLEETLEKMQLHRRSITYKIFRMNQAKAPKSDIEPLQAKLADIDRGIAEVFEKCNKIWRS